MSHFLAFATKRRGDRPTTPPPPAIAVATYENFGKAYADAIECNAWNAGYERPSTLALLPPVEGKHVLDAGCGPGVYSQWLVEHGATVTGLDASPTMVALAKERLGAAAEIRLWNLDEHPLPFADRHFDLVLSALSIHYLSDLEGTFREFARILRPAGKVVVSTHHPFVDYNNHSTGNYHATELVEEEWDTIGRPVKVRFYRRPLSNLFSAFLAAGFHIEELSEGRPSEECRRNHPQVFDKLSRAPGFLFIRLGL